MPSNEAGKDSAAPPKIPFAGDPLDRASDRRTDAAWIAEQRRDPNSRI